MKFLRVCVLACMFVCVRACACLCVCVYVGVRACVWVGGVCRECFCVGKIAPLSMVQGE